MTETCAARGETVDSLLLQTMVQICSLASLGSSSQGSLTDRHHCTKNNDNKKNKNKNNKSE